MLIEAIEWAASFFGAPSRVVTGAMLILVLVYWKRIASTGATVVGYISTVVVIIAALGALTVIGVIDFDLTQLLEMVRMVWDLGVSAVEVMG